MKNEKSNRNKSNISFLFARCNLFYLFNIINIKIKLILK